MDEIVPREVEKVDRNRRFHKRVSNFQEEIELPSLVLLFTLSLARKKLVA